MKSPVWKQIEEAIYKSIEPYMVHPHVPELVRALRKALSSLEDDEETG